MYHNRFWPTAVLASLAICQAADLSVSPAYLRPDPFGAIVASDSLENARPAHRITLETARGSYASCHLIAALPEGGDYQVDLQPFSPGSGIQADLYREWYHFVPSVKRYIPDALIPVRSPYRSHLPEPDNHVAGQTVQAFWLDFWVSPATPAGRYTTSATLRAGPNSATLPVEVRVRPAVVPNEDAVAIDHNSYGTSWFASQYPELVRRAGPDFWTSDRFYHLIHAYHRIFYEHRGVFHQLGYGHAGKVGPEFAPVLEGSGKNLHVAGWTAYDQHYGPLLDGSAFAQTRRGARPVPFVYLPINPEWPASFVNWGEPGYEREFVNVVSEMERHFREKGWIETRFEMFFNQKKRYKGFPWDGDEVRFSRDNAYFKQYAAWLRKAVPAASPVKFVFRADTSWTMERQFKELAGVVNFWVCGGTEFGWYDYAARMLKDRGDIVWIYGGTPAVTETSSQVTLDVLRPWIWGIDGFVRWQTTDPGADPWFHLEGGAETMVYPGERFGIDGPIPSLRLKLERNAVQDIALLHAVSRNRPIEQLRAEVAAQYNKTTLAEWHSPRPALADRNPEDVSNADYEDASNKNPKFTQMDAAAWERVHNYVMHLAGEAQ